MFCHKCGEQLAEGAAFCHNCGTEVIYEDKQNAADLVQTIEQGYVDGGNRNDFKQFVDNHVCATTNFQSADDLLTNSKPLRFVWTCIGISSAIGLIFWGATNMEDPIKWLLLELLVFGGFFGYVAVWMASGIIRMNYSAKFSGKFDQNINPDEFLLFLNENMRQVSPYFHEFGYLTQLGILTAIGKIFSDTRNDINLCCEFGPKKKNLATICIKSDSESGQMRYIVGAVRNGFMMDGRAAGFLAHACLIRTAPILQAAIKYYFMNSREKRRNDDVLS